jgi:hypothetical protein
MSEEDREEVRVRAVADGIRRTVTRPDAGDDVSRLIEAALGDKAALSDEAALGDEVTDDPDESGTAETRRADDP